MTRNQRILFAWALATTFVFACSPSPAPEPEDEAESWSVTVWGELYEIFPEVDALAAGERATAHTHVTVLDGFAPLTGGTVEIVLRGPAGESAFRATEPVRPGIFTVVLEPGTPGEHDLLFRVSSASGDEEIPGGRVRVGTPDAPGGLIGAPMREAATDGGEPLPFLKEQQWRTEFATAWVRDGSLARTVEGLARVRPAAGGDVTLTPPLDAVLRPQP